MTKLTGGKTPLITNNSRKIHFVETGNRILDALIGSTLENGPSSGDSKECRHDGFKIHDGNQS